MYQSRASQNKSDNTAYIVKMFIRG